MFQKIIANLPYSPALIGQLGFYARRLRKEQMTRRLGLIFTALAIVVQSFAVFNPPEAQARASHQNIIYQGTHSRAELLTVYDRGVDAAGHKDIRQIFNYFGISRADLASVRAGTFNSRGFNGGIWSVGRNSYDAGTQYEQARAIPGTSTTVFARKLWRFDKLPYTKIHGSNYAALIGNRASDGKWFAVSFDCGNMAFTEFYTPPPPPPAKKAACVNLIAQPITRNKYKLTATGSVANGAAIAGYNFSIIDSSGKSVFTASPRTNKTSASVEATLAEDGKYTAKVAVNTSVGNKVGPSCIKSFTVSPQPPCPLNPNLPDNSPDCKPCPSDSTIWYKDREKCKPDYQASKQVKNQTQMLSDADNSTARPDDRLLYTLAVKNVGKDTGSYAMKENISDVLEYANVLDAGGGTIDPESRVITWPETTIKPGETLTQTLLVQIKTNIPASPQNVGNPESYNCVITNSFGTTTNVNMVCPPIKTIENTVKELPSTGPGENILFGTILLMLVTYFFARSRQMNKEVRLIRHDFNMGTI